MDVNIKNPLLEFLPHAVENIRKIYNLDDGRVVQSVDILEDWVQKQTHFVNKNFSRRYLEITIIACKGSVEKAKMQVDKLCTYKTLLPKFFICSGIKSTCERLNDVANFIVLPKMTKQYERAYVLRINEKPFTSPLYLDYFRMIIVLAEYMKAHDYVNGFIVIQDFRDVNLLDLITKMNFVEFQQFMTIMTEGFGARLKGIHTISKSKAIDMFTKTMKTVLSEKLANRIHCHPSIEDLHNIVEKEILPIEFGGEERSINEIQAEWTKILTSEETEEYLKVMKASGTDESQRQTDKFNEQYMGIPGSFRTLTVD